MIFSFRKRTIEIVYCRYGVQIEANTYEEAFQLLKESNDWNFEKEEDGSVIQERFYYYGFLEPNHILPDEKEIDLFNRT